MAKNTSSSKVADVVRASSRLLGERGAKLTSLRQALVAGEKSGRAGPFDFVAFLARKRKSVSTRK